MGDFHRLAKLGEALDELDYLHRKLEWTGEETMVLRAAVKLHEVAREIEHDLHIGEYEELDEDYENAIGDLRSMRFRLT